MFDRQLGNTKSGVAESIYDFYLRFSDLSLTYKNLEVIASR